MSVFKLKISLSHITYKQKLKLNWKASNTSIKQTFQHCGNSPNVQMYCDQVSVNSNQAFLVERTMANYLNNLRLLQHFQIIENK